MKRKMLFFERFMYIDGVTPIHCVMTIRLRGNITPEQLHRALQKVQQKHPLLRARVVVENGEPKFVIDDTTPPIPIRILDRVSDEDWKHATEEEWKIPFDTAAGPLVRLIWLRSESLSDLLLTGHHCICDGSSIMTLVREILQVMDKPETELVPYTSYNSIEDLIPADVLHDPQRLKRVRRKVFFYKLLLSVLGRRAAPHNPGTPYVLSWRAEADRHAAINARCSAEDTNSYAALCVAFLLAFREIQGKRAKNKIMCPVSIRRFVRSVKSDMLFAFAPTIQLSLEKNAPTDFWEQARRMKESIADKIDHMQVYEELMISDRMRDWLPRIINFLRSSRGGHDIAFSNIGRMKVNTRYQNFELDTVMGATVSVPWRNANTLIGSQFQGWLELGFLSNELFLSKDEAAKILDCAIRHLDRALAQPVPAPQPELVSAV